MTGGCESGDKAASNRAGVAGETAAVASVQVDVPSDFSLGVTVFGGTGTAARVQAQAVAARRPARYVLEPGRVLRAASGPDLNARTVPPIVRSLSPEQVADVYAIARSAGLLVPRHGATVPTPANYSPPAGRTGGTTLISYTSGGRQASLALPAGDAAVRPLVERLAALAWFDRAP